MSGVKAAAAGARWTIGCQIFVSAAQFVVSGITSRIFSPVDFGSFAAAVSLLGILTLMTTTGLPSYVLKESTLSTGQISRIRGIAAVVGAVTAACYLVVAPFWLDLLKAGEGDQYLWLMAAAQAVGPIGGVESALLRRELDLKRDTVTVLLSFVVSALAGLLLAVSLRQAWALGVPMAISPVVLAISARFLQRRGYPGGQRLNGKELFHFARKITSQNVGFMLLQQTPGWVVSSVLGAGALGQFTKGVALAQMPATALTSIQSRIAQPHWRNAGSRRSFQDAVCDAAVLSSGVAFPAFAILSANGPFVINVWLGPGWALAGTMASTLAIGFALSIPFTLIAGSLEMRGEFRPARLAQWLMAGAMVPCVVALFLTRDVLWAGWMMLLSQITALVSLICVTKWENSNTVRRLMRGLVTGCFWAAAIGGSGLGVAMMLGDGAEDSFRADATHLGVAVVVSTVVWAGTFRWHAVSGVLTRRGFILPSFFRPANP